MDCTLEDYFAARFACVTYVLLQASAGAANPPSGTQPTDDAATQPTGDQNAELRRELEQLKQLVEQQQARITALEYQNSAAGTDGALGGSMTDLRSPMFGAEPQPVPKGLAFGSELPDTPAQVPQNTGSSDERIRNLERRLKGIGPLVVQW